MQDHIIKHINKYVERDCFSPNRIEQAEKLYTIYIIDNRQSARNVIRVSNDFPIRWWAKLGK